MMANKLLIANGCGVLTVSRKHLETFFQLLVSYYAHEEDKRELKQFFTFKTHRRHDSQTFLYRFLLPVI